MMFTQLRRFVTVGIFSTAVNYAVFFVLFEVARSPYALASGIGYAVGLIAGYFLNRTWTFSPAVEGAFKEIFLYGGVYSLSLLASLAVLRIYVEAFGVSPLIAQIVAIGVSTASNFIGLKFLVFHERAQRIIRRLAPLLTPPFFIVLAVKVCASFLFASRFATDGFLPFVNYFTETLQNPYEYFGGEGMFPYPSGMMFLVSVPFFLARGILPEFLFSSINAQAFLLRVPVLILDACIYFVLCYLLPLKEKKILWWYFASPILFYISYFHGQLDVIPTAFLLLSLFALFRGKETLSFALLGAGIAMKTHLLAALPFYAVYFWRNGAGLRKTGRLVAWAAGAFVFLNPYLGSGEFIKSVFNNVEQQRLFNLFVPFGFKGLEFLVAPAVILFLFYRFASYRRINKDFLLVTLGLVYTVLISFVPPMQGWFYWSLPFLVFFFGKFRGAPALSFWAMNAFYILYFAFTADSDIFESLKPVLPALAATPPPFSIVSRFGLDAPRIVNMFFTALEVSLLVNALWAYRMASSRNRLYQFAGKFFVMGIGGDSAVGKTRLARACEKIVGAKNMVRLCGDDAHRWERGHENWRVVTHLNPKGNQVHLDLEHIEAFLRGESVERPAYDHKTGTFGSHVTLEPKRFILFEGLLPFVLERMRKLFSFRVYIEADEELRGAWKMERDSGARGHTSENVQKQIEARKPDAEKFIHPQKEFADFIVRYSMRGEEMTMTCTVKNSIFIEHLVGALEVIPGLQTAHRYLDLNFQEISFRGTVSRERVEAVGGELFPGVPDVIENYPEFEGDFDGILQLFFLSVVADFYKVRSEDEE